MVEKKRIIYCQECEKEIKLKEKCCLISTGRFVGKDKLFRVYPTDSNQYFHEGCLKKKLIFYKFKANQKKREKVMGSQVVKRSFNSHIDFSEDLDLLEKIKVPKKYQHTLDKIKTGIFTRNITNAEKKLMEQNFKFQLDVFNSPANNSYQKEFENTMKKITKISGINEIEERLNVLKMMLLLSFDDFETSVKKLNDDRKEIGLKIRRLKQTTPKKPITEEIKKLEEE